MELPQSQPRLLGQRGRIVENRFALTKARSTDTVDTQRARELFQLRLCKSEEDFEKINGERGDVQQDQEFACGDTATVAASLVGAAWAIVENRFALTKAGSTNTVDTQRARELFRSRLCKSEEDFLKINGEKGDVQQDQDFACGDTALTFDSVSFSVNVGGTEKVILEPVSGHFEPGSLVAVMGPSGSGKTTFLDILAGKKSAPHGGMVHFNGRPRDG
eukprot:CAMPEP_0115337016 /NCGR_PEP_ID=MMETSP0270-20121206/89305_1 /TAXON_ID=71861 /ORGANISM="Scrippsiella trochoidea, Strain CCMP3099" /LENGTH=217 /DNA_ID=CAMNT_0002758209 /DNA_START=18 /DNA_END=669 /DNA_ORIENTATION=-